jgi:hypothetical protein
MPPQIGHIISEAVYKNQLKYKPLHPITDKVLACRLIDVAGSEKKNPSTGSVMVCFIISVFDIEITDAGDLES